MTPEEFTKILHRPKYLCVLKRFEYNNVTYIVNTNVQKYGLKFNTIDKIIEELFTLDNSLDIN